MSEQIEGSVVIDIGNGNEVTIWNIAVEEDERGTFISFDCDTDDEKEQALVRNIVLQSIEEHIESTGGEEEE